MGTPLELRGRFDDRPRFERSHREFARAAATGRLG
jgi:hypothetical protein